MDVANDVRTVARAPFGLMLRRRGGTEHQGTR